MDINILLSHSWFAEKTVNLYQWYYALLTAENISNGVFSKPNKEKRKLLERKYPLELSMTH